MDLKLEVVVIPVADVDRAKEFYTGLGWRLDADVAPTDEPRAVPGARRDGLAEETPGRQDRGG